MIRILFTVLPMCIAQMMKDTLIVRDDLITFSRDTSGRNRKGNKIRKLRSSKKYETRSSNSRKKPSNLHSSSPSSHHHHPHSHSSENSKKGSKKGWYSSYYEYSKKGSDYYHDDYSYYSKKSKRGSKYSEGSRKSSQDSDDEESLSPSFSPTSLNQTIILFESLSPSSHHHHPHSHGSYSKKGSTHYHDGENIIYPTYYSSKSKKWKKSSKSTKWSKGASYSASSKRFHSSRHSKDGESDTPSFSPIATLFKYNETTFSPSTSTTNGPMENQPFGLINLIPRKFEAPTSSPSLLKRVDLIDLKESSEDTLLPNSETKKIETPSLSPSLLKIVDLTDLKEPFEGTLSANSETKDTTYPFFNYNPESMKGPSYWDKVDIESDTIYRFFFDDLSNQCSESRQSPIDLKQSLDCRDNEKPITNRGKNKFDDLDFVITPSSLRVNLYHLRSGPTISFANLPSDLPAVFVDVKINSEHYINGKQYSGEFQIVHHDEKRDQLIILSILMNNERNQQNHQLEQYLLKWEEYSLQKKIQCGVQGVPKNAPPVHFSDVEMKQAWGEKPYASSSDFDLYRFMTTGWYFGYRGSITTPPCTQNVQWRILDVTMPISKNQHERMQNLLTESLDHYCQTNTASFNSQVNRPIQVKSKQNKRVWRCKREDWDIEKNDPFYWFENWPDNYHGWPTQ